MVIVGLTGGTGCGKTAAAGRFAHHGIPVVDADKVGHELIAPGGAAEAAVVEAFGEPILSRGIIDRTKLGEIVFADPVELARLNAIMKPLLAVSIAARCTLHKDQGAALCLVDAALLGDSGRLEPWLTWLVLVVCPEDIRVERLRNHRGLDETVARTRIAAQVDPEKKRKLARWVLDNSGSLDDLYAQVDVVAASMLAEVSE